ncbi:MAG: hypothetical protein AB7O45_07805, partial [Alphaproteobacteria bacterium]
IVANQHGADSADPLFRSLREGLEIFLVLFVVVYLLDLRARHLGIGLLARAPRRESRRDGLPRPGAPLGPDRPGVATPRRPGPAR